MQCSDLTHRWRRAGRPVAGPRPARHAAPPSPSSEAAPPPSRPEMAGCARVCDQPDHHMPRFRSGSAPGNTSTPAASRRSAPAGSRATAPASFSAYVYRRFRTQLHRIVVADGPQAQWRTSSVRNSLTLSAGVVATVEHSATTQTSSAWLTVASRFPAVCWLPPTAADRRCRAASGPTRPITGVVANFAACAPPASRPRLPVGSGDEGCSPGCRCRATGYRSSFDRRRISPTRLVALLARRAPVLYRRGHACPPRTDAADDRRRLPARA